MVRVLTVTNWYPPHHFGGYELSCYDVMTRLEDRGHEVHVLCGDTTLDHDRAPARPDHEARVRRTLRLYHDGSEVLRPGWRDRLTIERHNQRELRRALREVRPDVVSIWHLAGVSHGLLATIAAAGTPVVLSICDDWLTYGWRLDAWANAFNRSRARRVAGAVVERVLRVPSTLPDIGDLGTFLFVTRATEARALATARWHPVRRAVVWSGIDRSLYGPAGVARPWSWRLITTGRFDPRKGFETAIRALPHLPEEATLSCWGRGGDDERARLERVAADLGVGDRVTFGTLEREQLAEQYRSSDVMVFPSVWEEPFGLVPIEAMACGVPVVATGVGGSAEFLAHERNCLRFPAEDHEQLAASIRRLQADDGLRRRLVARGLDTAAEMDVDHLADVMEAWHRFEAGGRTGEPPPERPNPGGGGG